MITLRLALAFTLLSLLAGCSNIPPVTPLPPAFRIATWRDCRPHPDCDVFVNPHLPQWVPEEIIGKAGQKIDFKVRNNVARFAEPGVVFKTPEGVARFPCTRQNDHHVKCDNNGQLDVRYPYKLRILAPDGSVREYDPFVWNR